MVVDKSLAGFYAHLVFYYHPYTFSFEAVHILEHLLLNPDRILSPSERSLKELLAGIGSLNGFTGGAFLSFNIEVYAPYALPMFQALWEALHSPLALSKEDWEKELAILAQEDFF